MLQKRNKLRRRGNVAAADTVAEKINQLIVSNQKSKLSKLQDATPKQLWAAIKPRADNARNSHPLLSDSDAVNNFFASVCFDPSVTAITVPQSSACIIPDTDLYPFEVERMLSSIKPTASGYDRIPSWFLRSCSFELADIVCVIFQRSFSTSVVPLSWRTAIVSPIPKTPNPANLSDYRPISVTPILSRIAEKMVVRRWLRPSMSQEMLLDQYAFKPTGSTTCALVHFVHHATQMLEGNSYIRCLLIDFSKAFDTIDHQLLIEKLGLLPIPQTILQWIVSFLSHRSQVTRCGQFPSSIARINRSIVQGSGLGPSLYIAFKSDLKTRSVINSLFKFADDCTLLVPEQTDISIKDEFDAIKLWAKNNKMLINMLKTKEIVLHRPSPRGFVFPTPIDGIEIVREAKLLGLYFNDSISVASHVNYVLKSCSQRVYLIKQLRHQGLSLDHLTTVFYALIISRILYAAPAYSSLITAHDRSRLDCFLNKMFRFGVTNKRMDINALFNDVDLTLFKKCCKQEHCLHHLLPPIKINSIYTRKRGHSYTLPICKRDIYRNSFIPRCLFNIV